MSNISYLQNIIAQNTKKPQSNVTYEDPWSINNFKAKMTDGKDVTTYILRFLPPKEGESSPIQFAKRHVKKFNNAWLFEPCRNNLGGDYDCPICKARGNAYKQGQGDSAKFMAPDKKYWANVLVVKDPNEPENNGKIFKFDFGQKIYEKILAKISPEDEDETAVDIFDLVDGCDFKFKLKRGSWVNPETGKSQDVPSYDTSEFTAPCHIHYADGSDADVEEIKSKIFSLTEFLDPKWYKSAEEIQKKAIQKWGERFERFCNSSSETSGTVFGSDESQEDDDEPFTPPVNKAAKSEKLEKPKADSSDEEDDDDDDAAFFANLKKK